MKGDRLMSKGIYWKDAPEWAVAFGHTQDGLPVWVGEKGYAYCHRPRYTYEYGVLGQYREHLVEVITRQEAEEVERVGQRREEAANKAGELGVKYDSGKPEFRLIPQRALEDVAKVMTHGAKKYAPDNWRKVPNGHNRYMDAALRHINAHLQGNVRDEESGERHLAHAVCSLMMAMESK
jgi:hypothetical protein